MLPRFPLVSILVSVPAHPLPACPPTCPPARPPACLFVCVPLHGTALLSLQEGKEYAEENHLFFVETSAKTAANVNELFYEIGEWLKGFLRGTVDMMWVSRSVRLGGCHLLGTTGCLSVCGC